MTELDRRARRYGDAEVSRILQKAVDLQMAESLAAPSREGLTLRELEAVANEVGIDSRHVRRAAAEVLGGTGPSQWTWFTGRPATIVLERTLPGEIDDTSFEMIVAEIRRREAVTGQASVVGRTLTWHSVNPSETRSLEVLVTSRDGETSIRIEGRLHGVAGAWFGSLMGGIGGGVGFGVGVGVGVGALGSTLFAVTFPIAAIASSYVAARKIFSSTATRREAALLDLLERISGVADDALAAHEIDEARTGRPALSSPE
jgi:hypothetical protein